jgi:hypothetical protein
MSAHKSCPPDSHRAEFTDAAVTFICSTTGAVATVPRCLWTNPVTGKRCSRGLWSDHRYCRQHEPIS